MEWDLGRDEAEQGVAQEKGKRDPSKSSHARGASSGERGGRRLTEGKGGHGKPSSAGQEARAGWILESVLGRRYGSPSLSELGELSNSLLLLGGACWNRCLASLP